MRIKPCTLTALLWLFCTVANANLAMEIQALQTAWADINYQLDQDAKEPAFLTLIEQAQQVTQAYPGAAEGWIWLGIIQSTYAGVAGPFDSLSYAKAAKAALETALELDDTALDGSAYTSLGVLYFKVPGWPIGFGDDDKAAELLQKAIEINPKGIDSNYFYADYLTEQDQYEQAKKFLGIAQAAPVRPNRPIADQGRRAEIQTLLTTVNEELD